MEFLSNEQYLSMRSNGVARCCGLPMDADPVLKLYTPDANAVWLLSELAADGDVAFGLCDVGLGAPELRSVRLSELAAMRGPHGLKVAVDEGFVARQTLSAYAAEAIRDGSIND